MKKYKNIFKRRKFKKKKEKEQQSLLKLKSPETKDDNKLWCSRKIIFISIMFIFIIILTIYFIIFRNKKINALESVAKVEILEIDKNNNTYSGFEDMIPRTSLNNNTVPYLYELFNSRELFIEEKNQKIY